MRASRGKLAAAAKTPTSRANYAREMGHASWLIFMLCILMAASGIALAQKEKSAKTDLSGSYDGTAKNAAGEVIQVTFDLTEKQGVLAGMIRSDRGDFTITGGKHDGDAVTLEFDANGQTGTINLTLAENTLSGTWSAGGDGGPVEVKKVAAQTTPKEKS